MNGPFAFRRPDQECGLVPVLDPTRPLTESIESNRGGEAVLTAPCGTPDATGTLRGERKNVAIDVRKGRVNGERIVVTTGLRLERGVNANINPRPLCLPSGCPPASIEDMIWPHVVGLVEWGGGAARFSAEFDWRRGTAISVDAETVRVQARYDVTTVPWSLADVGANQPPLPTYVASGAIGYGRARPATLTRLVQLQHPNDAVLLKIPPYAASFEIQPMGASAMSAQILPVGQGYFVPVASPFPEPGANRPIHLFNGADVIRFANDNVADVPAFAFVIFTLDF